MPFQDWYLESQGLRFPLGEAKGDFYSMMLSLLGDKMSAPLPELLILTRRNDAEADELSIALGRRGHAVARCNVEDMDTDSTLTIGIDIGEHGASPTLRLGHVDRPNCTPRVVYIRHFDLDALSPAVEARIRGSDVLNKYHRQQWAAMTDALLHSGPQIVGANAVRANNDRIRQISTARLLGWAVPPTLVSNSTDDLRTFALASPSGILVKALGSHFVEEPSQMLNGFFPRVIKPRDAIAAAFDDQEHGVESSPVLCQWFVPSSYEVRAYVVDTDVRAFKIEKASHDDLWSNPSATGVEPMDIGTEASLALVRLSRSLGMDVTAIDLLHTDKGLVFLEANANGDWCWIESTIRGAGVTAMHAKYLERRIGEVTPE
jgi:glutathione synthase/RimK-type ligase-like ATP-grasp enzyme